MIRIAFLIDEIASPTAGTEKQLLLLLETLPRTNIEPILCCLRSSEWLNREFKACKLLSFGTSSLKPIPMLARLPSFCSFLRNYKIDIVQTHFRESNYFGVFAAKLARVPAIISTRRGMPYWRNAAEKSLLRAVNSVVDVFVSNSHASSDYFCSNENIPTEKMKVIHNGLDLANYQIDEAMRTANRTALGIDSKICAIGIVSNLKPMKGIDVFIKAASLVRDQSKDTRFFIIGEGPSRDELTALARSMGLESVVIFLGQRLDVPRILSAIDIGVLSSRSESFSNAIIEYQAAALPVVCTDVGGAREAIIDGTTGYLVPPGNERVLAARMLQLVKMPLKKQMGMAGRERVQDLFSIQSIARQYEELYMQIWTSRNECMI